MKWYLRFGYLFLFKYEALFEKVVLYQTFRIKSIDFDPFGMVMPGRNWAITGDTKYRYAYNGMEQDPEVSGTSNSYTTEFRQYDPRLGRWKSLDPLMSSFPWQSPYCAFDNKPTRLVDPSGLSSEGWVQGGTKEDGTKANDNEVHWVEGVNADNWDSEEYDYTAFFGSGGEPGYYGDTPGGQWGDETPITFKDDDSWEVSGYQEEVIVEFDKDDGGTYGIDKNFAKKKDIVASDGYVINEDNLQSLREVWHGYDEEQWRDAMKVVVYTSTVIVLVETCPQCIPHALKGARRLLRRGGGKSKGPNPFKGRDKEDLKKDLKSYKKLLKEHRKKLKDFKKDPFGKTDPKKLEEMKKDNPTEQVLKERVEKSRLGPLNKQIKKHQGEIRKIKEAMKEKKK